MSTTPTAGTSAAHVEPKPDEPTRADRGAALLAHHVEATHKWGASSQATLTRVLADLIAAAGEDPDLSFADALAGAWRQLD
jgi:hypothetical protein